MKKYARDFAWVIALTGLFFSLYFGEVLNQEPCRLCWYQRIALFPLALFLGIANYKNDRKLALYSLPLVAIGGLFAIYQSLSQIFPVLQSTALCGEANPCSLQGFLPLFSSGGFIAIALLIFFDRRSKINSCE